MCLHLGVHDIAFAPGQHVALHPGRAASLLLDGQPVGVLGEVHPVVRRNFDLPEQTICLAELDLDALIAAPSGWCGISGISRMPALNEDLAVVRG